MSFGYLFFSGDTAVGFEAWSLCHNQIFPSADCRTRQRSLHHKYFEINLQSPRPFLPQMYLVTSWDTAVSVAVGWEWVGMFGFSPCFHHQLRADTDWELSPHAVLSVRSVKWNWPKNQLVLGFAFCCASFCYWNHKRRLAPLRWWKLKAVLICSFKRKQNKTKCLCNVFDVASSTWSHKCLCKFSAAILAL